MHDWSAQNHAHLHHHLSRVRAACFGLNEPGPQEPPPAALPFALDRLTSLFGLTPFERDVLLLAAAMELDGPTARAVHDATEGVGLTWGFVLARLPGAHVDALSTAGALRAWRLVQAGPITIRAAEPLRLDERILDFLLGIESIDEALHPYLRPLSPAARSPSQRAAVRTLGRLIVRAARRGGVVVVQGADPESRRGVLRSVLRRLELPALTFGAEVLPADELRLDALARAARREALLRGAVLAVDDVGCRTSVRDQFLDLLGLPCVVLSERPLLEVRLEVTRVDVPIPTDGDQAEAWARVLRGPLAPVRPHLGELVSSWRLDRASMASAARTAASAITPETPTNERLSLLRAACRQVRPADFGGLAERIRPCATWEDLVLPADLVDSLREIEHQCLLRYRVFDQGGFARRSARGTGLLALFTGESGTGKSLAVEVLANSLGLDLCRVDLSNLMSKYIGETEKHLATVFDAAERGGVVLLFDEADAVFGRRTETKDSHDRFANLGVSYLLQRVEAFNGLAVLTTNFDDALDRAFLRRIRFVVQFPFPAEEQRAVLWSRAFPPETRTEGLDLDQLKRLDLPGGIIRNIALNAAFLAADRDGPVTMQDVLTAAQREYKRLKRPLGQLRIRS